MPDSSEDEKCRTDDLVRLYAETLYRYAFRLTGNSVDAEDLVQETFLAAHRSVSQLRSAENAFAWLVQILRREWFRILRTKGPNSQPVDLDDQIWEKEPPADLPVDAEELQAALNRLPVEFKEALVLFYFRDLKYRDIADATQAPLGTVMSRIARGKAALRLLLAEAHSPDGNLGRNQPKSVNGQKAAERTKLLATPTLPNGDKRDGSP